MIRPGRLAAACLLCALLFGCAGTQNRHDGTLEHIVVIWLNSPGNSVHQQKIMEESEVLKSIPGVISLKSGTVLASERAIVDSSFDVALIVSFSDRSALDAYLVHPLHVQLVNETLKPLVDRIRVYDFM